MVHAFPEQRKLAIKGKLVEFKKGKLDLHKYSLTNAFRIKRKVRIGNKTTYKISSAFPTTFADPEDVKFIRIKENE